MSPPPSNSACASSIAAPRGVSPGHGPARYGPPRRASHHTPAAPPTASRPASTGANITEDERGWSRIAGGLSRAYGALRSRGRQHGALRRACHRGRAVGAWVLGPLVHVLAAGERARPRAWHGRMGARVLHRG